MNAGGGGELGATTLSYSTNYDITENKDNDSQMNLQNGVGPILLYLDSCLVLFILFRVHLVVLFQYIYISDNFPCTV